MTWKTTRNGILLFGVIIPTACIGLGLFLYWEIRARKRLEDCEMCTMFIDGMYLRYKERQGKTTWYPQHPEGECAALGLIITDENEAHMFGRYSTEAQQAQHYKIHGAISPALNPWRYIQGLKEDDPRDLVLMYSKQRTHWRWHGLHDGYCDQTAWIVRPVFDYGGHWGDRDECWLNTAQLRERLEKTLEFLRNNDRPHWQLTHKEHGPFIDELRRMEVNGQ